MDYSELIVELRRTDQVWKDASKHYELMREAADAIDELLKAAKKMHAWIFLHSCYEWEVSDELGLSDEMNAELGYGGRLVGSVVPATPEDQYPPMPKEDV